MASLLTNNSSVVLSLFDYELNIHKVKYYIEKLLFLSNIREIIVFIKYS